MVAAENKNSLKYLEYFEGNRMTSGDDLNFGDGDGCKRKVV